MGRFKFIHSVNSPLKHLLLSVCLSYVLFYAGSLNAAPEINKGTSLEYSPENNNVMVITGSRIPRVNTISSTPVTTISSEEISISGSLSLLESIYSSPAFGSARDNSNTARSSRNLGAQQVDLRDLGPQRTLVLVNGRRYAPAGVDGIVDTSAIPAALVDRVETITGGASAVYGSEAISGVVNIILKEQFEGVELNSHYGATSEGDGEQYRFNLTTGGNFSDYKGNAYVHLDFSETKGIINKDRAISATTGALVDNPDDSGPTDGIPEKKWEPDFGRSTIIPQGNYRIPGVGTRVIDPTTGQLRAFETPEDRYRFDEGHLAVPLKTINAFAKANYSLNDQFELFSELSFSRTQSFRIIESAGENVSNIPVTNPNIPQVVLNAIASGNDPGATELGVRRRFTEFGPRSSSFERSAIRVAFGLAGHLTESWQYDTYYQYGRYTAINENFGRMRLDHLAASLSPENCDNFNSVQIQSQAARCPGSIDLFSENSINQDFIDFLGYQDIRTGLSQQQVWAANLTGEVLKMPAGPLNVALGLESRREKNDDIPSSIIQAGQSTSNLAPETKGQFDVKEVYAEAIIPLIDSDMTLMKGLELEVSFRHSDFSTVGNLTSWNAGLSWHPFDSLRVRGMQANAHRAPNIDELFRGPNEAFSAAADPCNQGGTAGVVATNCASQGIDNTFVQPEARIRNVTAGNINLSEEKSETTTLGFVYTPSEESAFYKLTLSADWFDIAIEEAITTPGLQTILDLCYTSANLSDPACQLITRAPDGEITEILRAALNTGFIELSGVDIAAQYQFGLDEIGFGKGEYGAISAQLNYTYLDQYDEESFPGSDIIHYAGTLSRPQNRYVLSTNYQLDDWRFNWTIKYLGNVRVDPDRSDGETGEFIAGRGLEDIEGYKIPAVSYSNVAVEYFLNDNVQFKSGITNLFDQELPLVVIGGRQNTQAGFYDFRGRAFYTGITINL